ncbi:unnamed protein product [Hermetia illucens]|uniref:Uncharacterized protein n=1 Tax=Hermetia illucens TaxID=343691 RepID=A0A7R8UZF6_HERIL|nr:adhesive plaque matrix protein [Hermetia illucens]CAD7089847.1 unnamed protein product [Hermetia illucens]
MITRRLIQTAILLTLCISCITASPPSEQLLPPPPAPYRRMPPAPHYRKVVVEPPGIMTRIARWFGINERPKEQQIEASYFQPQYKEAPYTNYYQGGPKAPCNLCNKDPWIPMFPGNLQYPLLKSEFPSHPQFKFNHHPNNNNFDAPSPHISLPTYRPPPPPNFTPLKRYPSTFSFPPGFKSIPPGGFRPPQNIPPFQKTSEPIPLPNLSQSPIPPLYDSVPFRDLSNNNHLLEPVESVTQFPLKQEVVPSQIPPNHGNEDASIEIIKSIPLKEFTSSVEYPIDVIQSPIVDLTISNPSPSSTVSPQPPILYSEQSNHISSSPAFEEHFAPTVHPHPAEVSILPQPTEPPITVQQPVHENYVTSISPQNNDNHFLPEVPKLTELGSYSPNLVPRQESFFSSPIVAYTEADSHAAASSHNVSYRNENNLDIGNFGHNIQNAYNPSTLGPPTTFSGEPFTTTEPPTTIPSIVPFEPHLEKKNRETPKHLLDSPIYYTPGSSPRPFTRDPSEIQFRNAGVDHPNSLWQSSPTATPWAFVPTPTSPYSTSLEASGVFAGISPPALYQSTPHPFEYRQNQRAKQVKQIVIPYTIDDKPTPFKVRFELNDQPAEDERYIQWANSHEIDLHEQQESKVVTATESPATISKTTKFLTKILASNIRELLRREHENKNKSRNSFDLVKLQKNIDDWTEQEFTSHTHKASTVSGRGRSKNIPNEYLTTTPSLTQLKELNLSTEPPSTPKNHATLLDNFELKKYEALTKLVDDNRIESFEAAAQLRTTTTESPHISPFYVRTVPPTPPTQAPQELWNHLKVSISPLTKEKVYVVTPQNHKVQTPAPGDNVGTFKSPRFLVRPTPGVSQSNKINSTNAFTPELFGLMGVSAYSPPAPVETLDGHSKVITIVTPSSFNKKRSAELERPTTTTPSAVPSTNQPKSS